MPDRLNETQGRRPAASAPPTRPRPHGGRPPLAALQAKAGNRAVASVIQRATGTEQLTSAAGQERAGTSAADDLVISAVTAPERQAPERTPKSKADDPKAKQKAAEDAAEEHKQEAATAALDRAGAADEVWKASGEARDARKHADAARADGDRLTRDAEAAERDQRASRADEQRHAGDAREADRRRAGAEGRAGTHRKTEQQARQKAEAARTEQEKCEKQAEQAEQRQKAAEADVARFQKQGEEAERKQKAAEADAARFRKEAEEADKARQAAEAEAQRRSAADDQAQERAAEAEVEAETRAAAEKDVQKWAQAAKDAVERAGKAEAEALEREGEAEAAKEALTEAGTEGARWATAGETARRGAKEAADEARRLTQEADAAAEAHREAQAEVTEHATTAERARAEAGKARAAAETYGTTAAQAREQAAAAERTAGEQAAAAAQAQGRAAAAAERHSAADTTETGARTAETEARTAQAEAKKAEEAAQESQASASDAKKPGKSAGQRLKETFSLTKAKQRIDPADTAILRGSAPVGGPLRSDATQGANQGLVRSTAQQGQVETGVNVVNSALGIINDGRDVAAGYKGRDGKGPESHQDRKKLRGKTAGLATNTLMGVNDVTKITDNAVRNAENLAGVAPLGATGGALTMGFSTLIAARDTVVIKDTFDKRKKLKEHFQGRAAARTRRLQTVLDELGTATGNLAQECAKLSGAQGDSAESVLQAVDRERGGIDGLRGELMEHLAAARDYAVDKQNRKLRKRTADLTGNVARTAAGAVAVAAVAGAVSGPIGPAVAGGTAAIGLGGLAVHKGRKKAVKRYNSVRHPDRHARPTHAQEGTEETEATEPRMSKDGKGGRKRDAWAEAFKVTKGVKQGKRQFNAQEIYALAAGPAVPVGRNVPDDIRREARDFLKDLKCDPARHNQTEEEWEASLNDPAQQKEWEGVIAKQLASA
ncbi:hypothetical protein ACH121_28335 [Streptomyces sp. NB004]|uniref:hypothetical protein n=1 Tax=unclassified Streptomyces TaxID=2593676 RepID=UPI00280AC7BE|nr:hypothetical protein [Streptomyces sp. VNUA74]WML81092.1 hypothetical protein Q3101_15130 [Streptomyces sp. VNUA74]